jgi:hypothetical protein
MSSAIYPKFREYALNMTLGAGGSPANPVVKALLVGQAGYTYSEDHQYLSDIPAAAREATSPALTDKTFTDGVFDASDTLCANETGETTGAVVLFIDTGSPSTSRLVVYLSDGQGVPLTPNGLDVAIVFNELGIFGL